MKGIILAGGAGTRLYPASLPISKILLPVYNKPMIYYPLCTLISAGVRDILIITNLEDDVNFQKLLGDGSQWGLKIRYQMQRVRRGIADAFLIGEKFIGKDNCALILGDNIFYGANFGAALAGAAARKEGATVFAYHVGDPGRFGVVEFDKNFKALSIEEKPKNPKSNYAVTGLYFYDNKAVDYAKKLKPSHRGELEITDLNNLYLTDGALNVETLDKGFVWMDTGTQDSMFQAADFVRAAQNNQGLQIACVEEAAYRAGFATAQQILQSIKDYPDNEYYAYVREVVKE